MRHVGLGNYTYLAGDPVFLKSLWNTVYYAIGAFLFILPLALVLALLINSTLIRIKSLFRIGYFLPILTSTVAATIMFLLIFNNEFGLINQGLASLGIPALKWLDEELVKISVLAVVTWRYTGINVLYFLTGLQSIPPELYEAAQVDGAGSWAQFRYITIPQLRPIALFVGVVTMIGSFQLFAEPMLLARRRTQRRQPDPRQLPLSHGLHQRQAGLRLRHRLGAGADHLRLVLNPALSLWRLQEGRLRRWTTHSARRAQRTIAYGFLFFILISMATPFVWMISNTFKEQSQIFERRPTLIPEEPHLRNYVSLFVDFDFHKHFLNSAFIAVVHTASHLFLASLAGFAFAKYTFPLKNFLFLVLLGSMMVPLYTIFIPLFVLVIRLGLVNSYAGVIIPGVAGAFGIFFMKQSMEAVPGELLDSARIDGASEFRIYWQIALPLVRPALAVLAVLAFMGSWNDFVWPLVVLRSRELQTLPVVMAGMVSLYRMEYGVVMAASLLSTLPILLLFLALQKQFLAGLTVGAVKS